MSDSPTPEFNEGGNAGLIVVVVTIIGLLAAGMIYSAYFKAPLGH